MRKRKLRLDLQENNNTVRAWSVADKNCHIPQLLAFFGQANSNDILNKC